MVHCCTLIRDNTLTAGGGGGETHMKRAGMRVISLRVVKFWFWSHGLGRSRQNAIIFSLKGLF